MKTTIRPSHRRCAAALAIIAAAIVLALLLAWGIMIVWIRGGPQPVHRIVIALPAPHMPAPTGRGA